MSAPSYGYEILLANTPLAEARARVTQALADQGFGILTEIDVQATLAKKLGIETSPYVILGACNPKLAHRALTSEPSIGLLLPCNVVLRAVEGGTLVQIAKPEAMFQVVGNPDVEPVAREADERLRAALEALA